MDPVARRLYVATGQWCPGPQPQCSAAVAVFDTRTGARLRLLTLPTERTEEVRLAVDPAAQRLVVVHTYLRWGRVDNVQEVAIFPTESGRLVRRTRLSLPYEVDGDPVVDPVSGRTFLVLARPHSYPVDWRLVDHAVAVFTTRTGALVGIVPLGAGAAQLAVDTRTGAAFATTYGPLLPSRAPAALGLVPGAGSGVRVLDPATSPPARAYAGMVYDDETQATVLFGGQGGAGLTDTWTWDGTTWTEQRLAVSPTEGRYTSMAYDAARRSILLLSHVGGKVYDASTGRYRYEARPAEFWTR